MLKKLPSIDWFETLGRGDVATVGGKNASLGEMVRTLGNEGIKVPAGFATTAEAYWSFIDANSLRPEIGALVDGWTKGRMPLQEAGSRIRQLVLQGAWPTELANAISESYRELGRRAGHENLSVAVRSSA